MTKKTLHMALALLLLATASLARVTARCVVRGQPEPPKDRAHLWIHILDDQDEFGHGIRVLADAANDASEFALTAEVISGTRTFEFVNDTPVYSDEGAVKLESMTLSEARTRSSSVTRVRATKEPENLLGRKIGYKCTLQSEN